MYKFTFNKKANDFISNSEKNENKVIIKITKPRICMWYEYRIGEEFEAIESKTLFTVRFTNNTAGLINKEDAEIVKFL